MPLETVPVGTTTPLDNPYIGTDQKTERGTSYNHTLRENLNVPRSGYMALITTHISTLNVVNPHMSQHNKGR